MLKLTLATKLMSAIAAALIAMVAISAVAVLGARNIAETGQKIYSEGFSRVEAATDVKVQFATVKGLLARAPLELDLGNLSKQKRQFITEGQALRAEIEKLNIGYGPQSEGRAGGQVVMVAMLRQYQEHALKVYEFMSHFAQDKALRALNGPVLEKQKKLDEAIAQTITTANELSAGYSDNMQNSISTLTTLVIVLSVVLVVLVGGLGFFIVRTSIKAINAMSGVTGHLAEGNLETEIPGVDRADEVGEMARSLEQIRTVGISAARTQASLDDASSPILLVDTDGLVIFANKAMHALYEFLADKVSDELEGFGEGSIINARFAHLHNASELHEQQLAELNSAVSLRMTAANRVLDVTASPVFNESGDRLGTVVEWNEMTEQVKIEREIAEIVHAAGEGDFSQRLSEEGREGFVLDLSRGINDLADNVNRGLTETVDVMSAMSTGNLDRRIEGDYRGQFLKLKDDVNKMGDQIASIANRIVVVSGAVRGAASEIGSGVSDLSMRTEHQASSLEETSASMEELSGTVRQNADNAQEANKLAAAARESAEDGGGIASQAIAAMDKIEESSSRITDIVGLIQEIAFQTNLLALNAAVEAARAGEAGKGFAVVANEVRALAQRASQASKDIEGLIATSDSQVSQGVDLVKKAGTSLQEIVSVNKQVAELVSEIAGASQEQSAGIDQVSKAITNMDEMTQQNAALVEETNAALSSAQTQISDLRQVVAFFQTGADMEDVQQTEDAEEDADHPVHSMQQTLNRVTGSGRSQGNAALAGSDEDWRVF